MAVLSEFEVWNVFMPRTGHTTQTYEDLLLAIDAKHHSVTEGKAGKVILEKPGLKVYFCGPVKSHEDLNDWSAVVAITHGTTTFLFMGNATCMAESDMLARQAIPDCDVIKLDHHGSSASTASALLRAATRE